MSKENYRKRTTSIAKGEYQPRKGEPRIWFESIKSMAQILSNENQNLLRTIIEYNPSSITELESISHRKKANLSRTLKTLEKFGIVELNKIRGKIIPRVKVTDFKVEFGLNYSSPIHLDSRAPARKIPNRVAEGI